MQTTFSGRLIHTYTGGSGQSARWTQGARALPFRPSPRALALFRLPGLPKRGRRAESGRVIRIVVVVAAR
jgi:hypothetical protein